jgi:hypothetical protein
MYERGRACRGVGSHSTGTPGNVQHSIHWSPSSTSSSMRLVKSLPKAQLLFAAEPWPRNTANKASVKHDAGVQRGRVAVWTPRQANENVSWVVACSSCPTAPAVPHSSLQKPPATATACQSWKFGGPSAPDHCRPCREAPDVAWVKLRMLRACGQSAARLVRMNCNCGRVYSAG